MHEWQGKWGWVLFYILMLVLVAQSTYEFAQSPHTIYRVVAAAMSIIGLIFVSVKLWVGLRAKG